MIRRRAVMYDEGVIKFAADHEKRPLEDRIYGAVACELIAWREIMAKTNLVGQEAHLYGGAGYGNVSARVGPYGESGRGRRRFIITGTQTGGIDCMTSRELCLVETYNCDRNQVKSFGDILPSSESLTHGMIYDLAPQVRFVFHAHSPLIWQRSRELRVPTTDPEVSYGTPAMAREVERLYRETALADLRILSMGGHEDGIITFAHTSDEAGNIMLRFLARAYSMVCSDRGAVCSTLR